MSAASQTGLAPTPDETALPVSDSEYREVCEFLYREAAALDSRQYEAWLRMLADDVSYYVGAPTVRAAGDSEREYPVFDEPADELRIRIEQISNPKLTHAENPPSITRRFVANILVSRGSRPNELEVTSNIMLHRSHGVDAETHVYTGTRSDILRRRDSVLVLARRRVKLDRPLISSMNMTVPI